MTVSDPVTEVHSTFQQSPVTARPRRGVVLHHAATTNMDQVISMETTGSREVSSNRVVKDARNAKIANDPEYRAWSLASAYWDSVLSSVECANESTVGWTISDASHETLAHQVAWWAQRDGFRPHREGAPAGWTVFGHREVYQYLGASYATACPGGMNLDFVTVRAQQILASGTGPVLTPEQIEELELVSAADDIVARISANIRRDGRARLYQNAATKQYVAITWDLPANDPSKIRFANGGLDQIKRWYNPYQVVGDAPEQAQVLQPDEWTTLIRLAKGIDSSNTPDPKLFPEIATITGVTK